MNLLKLTSLGLLVFKKGANIVLVSTFKEKLKYRIIRFWGINFILDE